jgi:hypothetical protein
MSKSRDMTRAQFENALARHGMREVGFLGYVEISSGDSRVNVSALNAGTNRRRQLAYLIAEQATHRKRIAERDARLEKWKRDASELETAEVERLVAARREDGAPIGFRPAFLDGCDFRTRQIVAFFRERAQNAGGPHEYEEMKAAADLLEREFSVSPRGDTKETA